MLPVMSILLVLEGNNNVLVVSFICFVFGVVGIETLARRKFGCFHHSRTGFGTEEVLLLLLLLLLLSISMSALDTVCKWLLMALLSLSTNVVAKDNGEHSMVISSLRLLSIMLIVTEWL
jgi:hypothetical protein